MTTQETRRYEMFVRVGEFGEAHRDMFPPASVGGRAFATVAAAVTQLSAHAVSKMSTAREGSGAKSAMRQALVDRIEAICRTARVIAEGTPGIADAFRLPRRRTDQSLLTLGRVVAREAEPLKVDFIAHGMTEDFIADLTTTSEKFDLAIRGREAGKNDQTAAQAGIAAAMASGLAAVRKLDVIVANQFRDDPVTLAVWQRDRRVTAARAKGTGAPVNPEPQPPAADSALKVAS